MGSTEMVARTLRFGQDWLTDVGNSSSSIYTRKRASSDPTPCVVRVHSHVYLWNPGLSPTPPLHTHTHAHARTPWPRQKNTAPPSSRLGTPGVPWPPRSHSYVTRPRRCGERGSLEEALSQSQSRPREPQFLPTFSGRNDPRLPRDVGAQAAAPAHVTARRAKDLCSGRWHLRPGRTAPVLASALAQ